MNSIIPMNVKIPTEIRTPMKIREKLGIVTFDPVDAAEMTENTDQM